MGADCRSLLYIFSKPKKRFATEGAECTEKNQQCMLFFMQTHLVSAARYPYSFGFFECSVFFVAELRFLR
jgi:hypothetical protein